MTQLQLHVATSLSEYLALVSSINHAQGERTWFRGHSTAEYRLTPSVLRETVPLQDARGNLLRGDERLISSGNTVTGLSPERMLDTFRRKARPFVTPLPVNDFEWLFLMQHYGVPTRLLDWTTNALVALYFATEPLSPKRHTSVPEAAQRYLDGDDVRDDGFAIWAMDPHAINHELHGLRFAVDITVEEDWAPYARPMEPSVMDTFAPVCVVAPHNSPRIRAQSGAFTLHGSNVWPIDYYDVLRPLLHKIFVPYAHLAAIQDELVGVGLGASFIYPDLGGIALEVKIEEMRRYGLERAQWLSRVVPHS